MAVIIVPDFVNSPRPDLPMVQDAERSVVQALGGQYDGDDYPGALDGTNIAADAGFRLHQVAEAHHRVALGMGRTSPLVPEGAVEVAGASVLMIVVPFEVTCDVLQIQHSAPMRLRGQISVLKDGAALVTIPLPEGGVSNGEVFEVAFPFTLEADTLLEIRVIDGTNLLVQLDGSAPPTYTRADAVVWGVAPHFAW